MAGVALYEWRLMTETREPPPASISAYLRDLVERAARSRERYTDDGRERER